jgi:hypothetical protein
MAIASGGTLGTGANSTSNSTFTFTTATNTLAAGDFGILTVVSDNIDTADGRGHTHTLPSGGTGRWSKLAEYTNAPSAATAVGATVSIWIFEATGTVNTGTTITVNFSANVVDKCCSFWKFTVGAGNTLILNRESVGEGVIVSEVNGANGFGSSAFSGLSNISRLYFRGLGKEVNSTTDLTVSSGFTLITLTRSRNNAAAVILRGEFRIVTATGETSNPTLAVSGDSAGLFLALEEVTKVAPSTLTDNFDDNSLDGAKWMNASGTGTIAETNQRIELTTGTTALGYAAAASVNVYNLIGASVYGQLTTFGQSGTDFDYTALRVHVDGGSYAWTIAGDNAAQDIYVNKVENDLGGGYLGANGSDLFTTSYNSSTHAWFRIRHETSDDKIYWDTAPSSAANPPGSGEWVNRWSEARGMSANVRVLLECHAITGTTSTMSAWDGFNTATVAAVVTTPSAGVIAYAGQTPTKAVTAHVWTLPAVGAITYAGQTPSVSAPQVVTPSAGAVAYIGQQPTAAVTAHVFVTPLAGAKTYAGQTPLEVVTAHQWTLPSAGAMAYAGQASAPVVTAHQVVVPSAGALAYAGLAPTEVVTENVFLSPLVGALVYAGETPTESVTAHVFRTPSAGDLVYSGTIPTEAVTAHVFTSPTAGSVEYAGQIPVFSIAASQWVLPSAGAVVYTGAQPTESVTSHVFLNPGVGALVYAGQAPSFQATAHHTIAGTAGAIAYAGQQPTEVISASGTTQPSAGALVYAGLAPTYIVTAQQTTFSASGSVEYQGTASTLGLPVFASPGVGSAVYQGNAPTPSSAANQVAQPSAGFVVYSGGIPQVVYTAESIVLPGTGAIVYQGFAPQVGAFILPEEQWLHRVGGSLWMHEVHGARVHVVTGNNGTHEV